MDIYHELITPNLRTTSRLVAEKFGKRHADVLRSIEKTASDAPEEFSQRNFALAEYLDAQGKPREMYELTRDGFVLLAMGFTGAAAMAWKVRFIEAFNMMEAEISSKLRASEPAAVPDDLAPVALGEISTFVNTVRHTFNKAEAARIYNLLVPPALRSSRAATPTGLLASPGEGRACLTLLLGLDVGGRSVSEWIADGQDSVPLNRVGLRVRDDGLFVAHQTPLFAASRWSGGRHRAALAMLDGVYPVPNPLTLLSRRDRGLLVPLSTIAGGFNAAE